MADPIVNFYKSTLVGTYSDTDTSLTVATGDGALLPDPSTDGAFNLTIFEGVQVTNSTSFEIVRVTARSGDVLTVTRGAESTTPLTIGSATHSILMSATKKTFDDIRSDIDNIDLTTITGAESIKFDTTGDEVFQFPAGTTAQRPASPSAGYARYNTDTGKLEIYTGVSWLGIVPEGLVELGVATATVSAQDAEAVLSAFFEQFGTPEAGYSVRQLGDSTLAMRVRRSSDNAETNIGFTASGDLDESALTTFTGANDGFVTTWYNQAVDTETLPADFGSGATASYSLRKVESAYTGDAIRVRRASDNAEQDIGFVDGELDTSSLETFCGAGDGFVTTWYDQSGSNNATQATAGSQPQIVSSGSTITENGKPALDFDGTDDELDTGISQFTVPFHVFVVNSFVEADDESVFGNWNSGSEDFFYRRDDVGTLRVVNDNGQIISGGSASNNESHISSILNSSTTMNLFLDGSEIDSTTGSSGVLSSGANICIGNIGFGNTFNQLNGVVQEFVLYESDQSANREAIEANQASFYDIGISGSHAVQGTAGSQPKIVSSGSVIKENGLPAIDFDGVDDFLDNASVNLTADKPSLFAVTTRQGDGDVSFNRIFSVSSDASGAGANDISLYYDVDDGDGQRIFLRPSTTLYTNTFTTKTAINEQILHTFIYDESNVKYYEDGVELINDSFSVSFNANFSNLSIGDRLGGASDDYNGLIQEIVFYPTDQSANRTDIESNIADYFNITI